MNDTAAVMPSALPVMMSTYHGHMTRVGNTDHRVRGGVGGGDGVTRGGIDFTFAVQSELFNSGLNPGLAPPPLLEGCFKTLRNFQNYF